MHRFQLSENNLCDQCQVPETVEHYLLECNKYNQYRAQMITRLNKIQPNQIDLKLLLGGMQNTNSKKKKIIQLLLQYVKDSGRLNEL